MTRKTPRGNIGNVNSILTLQVIIAAAKLIVDRAMLDETYVPTDTKVCISIPISRQTLYRRLNDAKEVGGEDYNALSDTLQLIETLQRERLISNALTDKWNANFAKFVLNTNHGMRETNTQENLNVDVNKSTETTTSNDESTTAIREALIKLSGQSNSRD